MKWLSKECRGTRGRKPDHRACRVRYGSVGPGKPAAVCDCPCGHGTQQGAHAIHGEEIDFVVIDEDLAKDEDEY